MLLTITTTREPATDLGYLLHKHPQRVQEFTLSFGSAHVFYPEADEDRCTAALLLDVDPIALVRNRRGPAGEGRSLEQYVNDRPYVASSLMSVAIAQVFGSALGGRCKDKPELVEMALPLEVTLAVVPARRGGGELLRRLFEPLGYELELTQHPLDERFPEWGEGPYHTLTLRAKRPLQELLNHLYVLVPVLDNDKHYWIGQDEIEKLLKRGEGWLSGHGRQAGRLCPAHQEGPRPTGDQVPRAPLPAHHLRPRVHAPGQPRAPAPAQPRPQARPGPARVRPGRRGPGALRPPRAAAPRARVRVRCARPGERAGRSKAVTAARQSEKSRKSLGGFRGSDYVRSTMGDHTIQFEVAGPCAMFTRPDTGATPVSYPVPTWSAAKAS